MQFATVAKMDSLPISLPPCSLALETCMLRERAWHTFTQPRRTAVCPLSHGTWIGLRETSQRTKNEQLYSTHCNQSFGKQIKECQILTIFSWGREKVEWEGNNEPNRKLFPNSSLLRQGELGASPCYGPGQEYEGKREWFSFYWLFKIFIFLFILRCGPQNNEFIKFNSVHPYWIFTICRAPCQSSLYCLFTVDNTLWQSLI